MIASLHSVLPPSVITLLPETIDQYQINTPNRLAHFLAQCAHESGNFRLVRENLNYSGDALLKIFPRHFKTRTDVVDYARRPERIANRVYANRIGNGPEDSGDGWRFRGRGYIQLTGRSNYAAFARAVVDDVLEVPELVAVRYPILSAGWFWNTRNLNAVAEGGPTTETISRVTRFVNGGLHGLTDRIKYFNTYWALLNAA